MEDLGEDPCGPDPWEAAVHNKVSGELGRPASGVGAGGLTPPPPTPPPPPSTPPTKVSPDDGHHEYYMRKAQREGQGDAVFNGLAYKPVSVMMPVPEKEDNPYWGWFVSAGPRREPAPARH